MLSWIDGFKKWRYNNRSELRQLGETVSVGFMSMQTLVINFNEMPDDLMFDVSGDYQHADIPKTSFTF